jgi:DNA invertase Pin-like site-specific DNA recombinase
MPPTSNACAGNNSGMTKYALAMTTITRAAVYLRISSDPRDTQLGIGRQREDCEKLCKAKGWTPIEYADNDISASNGKHRPAYERLLADIEAGEVGAVVAWDLDRLHRRPVELERFMELADAHRLALATVSGDVDLSTEQGRLVARMKGNVAAYEVGQMKARMCRQHMQKAEHGVPAWSRAFGYAGDTRQPDPVTAPLVQQAYAAVLAGSSLSDICALFNTNGGIPASGKPWTAALVSQFMRKPRNAGLRSHNGEIVGSGTWPGLVDESLWRAAQAVLEAPGRAPGRKTVRRHLLTGVLRCGKPGCGHYLSGHVTMKKVFAYTCKKCRGVAVRGVDVESLIYRLVAGRLAMDDAVDLLKAELHDAALAERLRAELNGLYEELDNIGRERGEQLLTGPQAKIATEIINGKIAVLQRREQDGERLRVFAGLPLGTPEVANAVERLSPDRFRAVLSVLAEFTVDPVGKGRHVFDPERVRVDWR